MSNLFLIALMGVVLLRGGLSSPSCRTTTTSFQCQELTELPPGVGFNVTRVDVSYSRFSVIGNNFFRGWNEVRAFFAPHSNITKVERGAFRRLENLATVDLSFNQIETLHYGVFENNYRLDVVYLTGNPLTVPAGLPILQSDSLRKLVADHTQINHFSDESFNLMRNVGYLSFQGNTVVKFGYDAIRSLHKLENLIFGKPSGADCYQQSVFQMLQKIKEQTVLSADICLSEATSTTVGREGDQEKKLKPNTSQTRSSISIPNISNENTLQDQTAELKLDYFVYGTTFGLVLFVFIGVIIFKTWQHLQERKRIPIPQDDNV